MRRALLLTAVLCLLLVGCAAEGPGPVEAQDPIPPAEAQDPVPPAEALPVEPEPAETLPGGLTVHTDWSRLGQREEPPEPVGTRWYEEYTDRLIPRDDYGPLIPYAGLRLMDNWPASDGCLYGLMTREGKVVTDPVFSAAYYPGSYDASGKWQRLPLLVLKKGDPTADPNLYDPVVCAVAAADGSWCTPFDYRVVFAGSERLVLFQEDRLSVMAPDGEIQRVWTPSEMGLSQEGFNALLSDILWNDGWFRQRPGDYMALDWEPDSDYRRLRCFHLVTGEIKVFSVEEWDALSGVMSQQPEPAPAIPDATRMGDQLLGDDAPGLLVLTEYADSGVTWTFYREDGTPLPQFTMKGEKWYRQVSVVGGLIEVLDWNTATYYDLDTLECRFRTYLNYEGD